MSRTLAGAVLAALLAVSCGNADAGSGGTPTPTSSRSLDPNFDTGQSISISADSFAPAWLVAVVGRPIVWTNDGSAPVQVVFDSGAVSSGPIEPGATFAYTPTAEVSIAYHAKGDPKMKGVIQVEPEYMPGETPPAS